MRVYCCTVQDGGASVDIPFSLRSLTVVIVPLPDRLLLDIIKASQTTLSILNLEGVRTGEVPVLDDALPLVSPVLQRLTFVIDDDFPALDQLVSLCYLEVELTNFNVLEAFIATLQPSSTLRKLRINWRGGANHLGYVARLLALGLKEPPTLAGLETLEVSYGQARDTPWREDVEELEDSGREVGVDVRWLDDYDVFDVSVEAED